MPAFFKLAMSANRDARILFADLEPASPFDPIQTFCAAMKRTERSRIVRDKIATDRVQGRDSLLVEPKTRQSCKAADRAANFCRKVAGSFWCGLRW